MQESRRENESLGVVEGTTFPPIFLNFPFLKKKKKCFLSLGILNTKNASVSFPCLSHDLKFLNQTRHERSLCFSFWYRRNRTKETSFKKAMS